MSSGFRTVLFLLGLALAVPAIHVSAQSPAPAATNPLIGVWVLNVAKSTYDPGPALKGETRSFDYAGDGVILCTRHRIEANGSLTFGHWLQKTDGQFYPEFSRALKTTPVSWLAFKQVDANKIEISVRHDGVVDGKGSFTVSGDGKTLTYVLQGKNSRGGPSNTVRIYDRQ